LRKAHPHVAQERPHSEEAAQPADGSTKSDAVEAAQGAADVFLVSCDKLTHGVAPGRLRKELVLIPSLYPREPRFSCLDHVRKNRPPSVEPERSSRTNPSYQSGRRSPATSRREAAGPSVAAEGSAGLFVSLG